MYSSKLYISKRFSMSVIYMEYFVYSSMLCQLKVHNIVQEPGRMNLVGNFELSAFIRRLLIFRRHTVTNKKSSRKF